MTGNMLGRWSQLRLGDKIRRVILFASGVVLFLAALMFGLFEYKLYRDALSERLQVVSSVVATNARAALVFEDRGTGEKILQAMASEPEVNAALIVLPDGRLFAGYAREPGGVEAMRAEDAAWYGDVAATDDGVAMRFDDDDLDLLMPIVVDGEAVGRLMVEATLGGFYDKIGMLAAQLAVLYLVLMGFLFLLANRMQRRITGPVQTLVDAMQRVSEEKDFRLRVANTEADEIADLVDSFNRMLGEIEGRDSELARYREGLEDQIEERTADLVEARDRAEQGSKAKSEFLATMSHEIRTPMNGVLGMTELLMGTGLGARQYRLAEAAHQSAEGLLAVINNILDFSKIEVGRLELSNEPFVLRELLEDTLDMFAGQATQKGLHLVADLQPDMAVVVDGDAGRLRQVLINLLGNAVKFTRAGHVVLRARTQRRDGDRQWVEIDVRDTGIGIDADRLEQIFDPFAQADTSTSRRFGGTGLGLSISRKLIEIMGGSIGVVSQPGQGATFRIVLDLPYVHDADPLRQEVALLDRVRLMAVVPDTVLREPFLGQLRAFGMRASAELGAVGLIELLRRAAVAGDPYRMVVLDAADGFAARSKLVRRIAAEPLIPPTSVHVLTAIGETVPTGDGRFGPADCTIPKPVRRDPLLRCLAASLSSSVAPEPVPGRTRSVPRPKVGGRVLLAEDNVINQEVALGMLEIIGCEVDVAVDGREVLDAVENTDYDIVLMDCHMPVIDGFEATGELRKREADGRHVPIIALTADVQKGIQERCQAAGMDDYMSKPFDQQVLEEKLATWLPGGAHAAAAAAEVPGESGHAARQGEPGVLDAAKIELLRSIGARTGKDTLGRVVHAYLEEAKVQLEAIAAAIATDDLDTLASTAHAFKSASANVGAMAVSRVAARLEVAGRDGDDAALPDLEKALGETLPAALDALRELDARMPGTEPGPATRLQPGADSPRILVVDDDSGFRRTAVDFLHAEGFSASEAADGPNALMQLRLRRPDLIMLDAVMPGMDGFSVCRQIRKQVEFSDVPVLMVTGLDDIAAVDRAFESGATGFAGKPVNYAVLLQRIRFMLRSSEREAELRENQLRLETAQRLARLGYWRWIPDSDDLEISEQLGSMCGLSGASAVDSLDSFLALVHPDEQRRVEAQLEQARQGKTAGGIEYRLIRSGQDPLLVQQVVDVRSDAGGVDAILGTVQDISSQRAAEEQIRKLAYYDTLTGLASRTYLMQHLDDMIRSAQRREERFALLFLDLDGFKIVNDSLGHDMGDHLLTRVARRLQTVVREIDFIARLGGDEFCILIDNYQDEVDAADVANRCLEIINKPLELKGQPVRIGVSIGVASYPIDGSEPGALLKAADSAMYAAKQSGKNRYAFYQREMTQAVEQRLRVERELREALELGSFELAYQPQVSLVDGAVTGVEALARWRHPDRGMVMPAEFIPVLERMHLIHELGEWVIDTSFRQLAAWRDMGLPPLDMAINLSPLHLRQPGMLGAMIEATERYAIDPERVEVEVTETALQSDLQSTGTLREMKEAGLRVAIDDFGTGYSALESLKHLPVDTLKIDRSFVRDIFNNHSDAVMLGTIIGLAHALGYRVVAEGVEYSDQVKVLAGLNCDLAQGFYFDTAKPAQELTDLLRRGFVPQVLEGEVIG